MNEEQQRALAALVEAAKHARARFISLDLGRRCVLELDAAVTAVRLAFNTP